MAHTRAHVVETRGDRAALAHHAGQDADQRDASQAGVLVAYGAFAVLLAITAAVAESAGLDTDLTANEWRGLGTTGGAIVAGVLLVCYLFGGYVAGRMARRAGATNGVMVFVLGLLVAVGVTGLVNVFTDGDDILRNLRNVGIPTSGEEWEDVATVAGLGSLELAAVVLGLGPVSTGDTPATTVLDRDRGEDDRVPAGYADGDVAPTTSAGADRRFTAADPGGDDAPVASGPDDGLTRAERRRLRSR